MAYNDRGGRDDYDRDRQTGRPGGTGGSYYGQGGGFGREESGREGGFRGGEQG